MTEDGQDEKKGTGIKLFGMSLILLASLNMMFCWRGGFPLGFFFPALMAAGILLFAVGNVNR